MSGSFGEMGNLLAQAQKLQRAMQEAKEEVAGERVTGTSGGGVVTVTITGDGQVTDVQLDPDVMEDREGLEELLVAALADGIAKATKLREERMSKVTGGLNLPGLM